MTEEVMMPNLPPNPFRNGSQNHRLYEYLRRYGWAFNWQILNGLGGKRIMNYSGRLSDIRAFLAQYGISLNTSPVGGGTYKHWIGGQP